VTFVPDRDASLRAQTQKVPAPSNTRLFTAFRHACVHGVNGSIIRDDDHNE